MSGTIAETTYSPEPSAQSNPSDAEEWAAYYAQVVTEDDEPVDNLFSEKQQRLLAQTLYASWTPPPGKKQAPGEPRVFLAAANVGLFYAKPQRPLVPDLMVSLDVQPHQDWYAKEHRSYFIWEFGKRPEVVVEIVSNRVGGELSRKLDTYAEIGILYYVVYDPQRYLSEAVLQVFVLRDGEYQALEGPYLRRVGLRLMLWDGVFEGHADTWLRWCDAQGRLLLTGEERAAEEAEARRAAEERAAEESEARQAAETRAAGEIEARRAAEAHAAQETGARRAAEERATQEAERAAQLAAKLRELGIDPDRL